MPSFFGTNIKIYAIPWYRQCDLARLYNVSPNAIRCSVGRIKNALVNLQDEGIFDFKRYIKRLKSIEYKFLEKICKYSRKILKFII